MVGIAIATVRERESAVLISMGSEGERTYGYLHLRRSDVLSLEEPVDVDARVEGENVVAAAVYSEIAN